MDRKTFSLILTSITLAAFAFMAPQSARACSAIGGTGHFSAYTAAVINPPGTVSGDVNASGCDIGVYYGANATGAVDSATIHDAKKFGIVVDGDDGPASADVTNSTIRNIGDVPFDGSQYGVGIYYRALASSASSATGTVAGNTVSDYQKGGIVANGAGAAVQISDNVVTGLGAVDFIAQNGIQVGFGATASVMRNTVSGNQYTGSGGTFGGGILVVGGSSWCDYYGDGFCPALPDTTGAQIVKNVLTDNDVGVSIENYEGSSFDLPSTRTNIKVVNNTVSDDACQNLTYQAGIEDVGNNDKLIHNTISGSGYDSSSCTGLPYGDYAIDDSYTTGAKVHADVIEP